MFLSMNGLVLLKVTNIILSSTRVCKKFDWVIKRHFLQSGEFDKDSRSD